MNAVAYVHGVVVDDVEVKLEVGQEGSPLSVGVGVKDQARKEGDDGHGSRGETVSHSAVIHCNPPHFGQHAHEERNAWVVGRGGGKWEVFVRECSTAAVLAKIGHFQHVFYFQFHALIKEGRVFALVLTFNRLRLGFKFVPNLICKKWIEFRRC